MLDTPHVRPATQEEFDSDIRFYGRSSGTRPHTYATATEEIRDRIRHLKLVWKQTEAILTPKEQDKHYVDDVEALRNFWRDKIGKPPKIKWGQSGTRPRKAEALDALDKLLQKLNPPPAPNAGKGDDDTKHGKRKQRGRPVDTNLKEDAQIFDAWKTGQYANYEDLGRQFHKTRYEAGKIIDREGKRRKRDAESNH